MDRGQAISWLILMIWLLIIIGAFSFVIATSLGNVFASKQDVRHAESSILAGTILECVAKEGVINVNFGLSACYVESQDLYVSANLISLDSNFSKFIESGNKDLNLFCQLQKQGEEQNAAKCASQKYYVLIMKDSKLERGMLELTAGVEKYGSNI